MYGSNIYRPIFVFTFLKISSYSDSVMAERLDYMDTASMRSKTEKSVIYGTTYVCPWKKYRHPSVYALAKWKVFAPNNTSLPSEEELNEVLKIHEVDASKLDKPPDDKIQVTWIGHATVLVQFDGISILSDPVFLDYCGPNRITGYKRYRKAACEIRDIMKLDAVVISHNHYDHLETGAVQEIAERFPDVKWFVTLKQKEWFVGKGVKKEQIVELDWWEESEEPFEKSGKFTFVCTPAQHWCARFPGYDDNKCLWCSWVIKGPNKSYYFAGDTGYYEPLFKTIGEKYGPFHLAAIPIGAYEPRYITKYQHVDPAEAVKIHKDIKAIQSIGMHWGTFALTNEFFVEPPQKVEEEMIKRDLDPEKFISLCHGETWCVGDERDRPLFMTYKAPVTNYSEDIS